MVGTVLVVLVLLIARPLGWNTAASRLALALATLCFALALMATGLAATGAVKSWAALHGVATAAGALLLFVSLLQLTPLSRPDDARTAARSDRARKRRKATRILDRFAQGAEDQQAESDGDGDGDGDGEEGRDAQSE